MSLEFNAFHLLLLFIALSLLGFGINFLAGLMVGGPLNNVGEAILAVSLK